MSTRAEIRLAINSINEGERIGLREGVYSCNGAGNTWPYGDNWERVGEVISVDIGRANTDPKIYEVESCKYFRRGACRHPQAIERRCDRNNTSQLNGEKLSPGDALKFVKEVRSKIK